MKWARRLVYRLVRRDVEAEVARAAAESRHYTNAAISIGFAKATDLILEGARQAHSADETLADNVIKLHETVMREIRVLAGDRDSPPPAETKPTIN